MDLQSTKIYPSQPLDTKFRNEVSIADQRSSAIVSLTEESVKNGLNKIRAKQILDKLEFIRKDYQHYRKLRSKWNVIDKTTRIVGYSIGGVLAAAAAIVGLFTTAGIVLPAVFAGGAALEALFTELMSEGVFQRKAKRYEKMTNDIQSFIDKFYIFTQKTLEDEIVTDDELKIFQKLIDEYNLVVNKHKKEYREENANIQLIINNLAKNPDFLKKLKNIK